MKNQFRELLLDRRNRRETNDANITVMYSFFYRPKRKAENPYSSDLIKSLEDSYGINSKYLTLKTLLTQKIDVVHIQWPEYMVMGPSRVRNFYKLFLTALLLLRSKVFGIPIIRTVHNTAPHDDSTRFENYFLNLIERSIDIRIFLNESSENKAEGSVVILHPVYERVVNEKRLLKSSNNLLAFGSIRPYKGFETLIKAFHELDLDERRLKICGRPLSKQYGSSLKELADCDPRIIFQQDFLPEEGLQSTILDADLVILPYRDIYNSGAALLALSLGVPVLLTRSPSTESLCEEIGSDWVQLFTFPLTPEKLEKAHEKAISTRARGIVPDLSRRSNGTHAELHAVVYRCVRDARRNRRSVSSISDWRDSKIHLLNEHSRKNSSER